MSILVPSPLGLITGRLYIEAAMQPSNLQKVTDLIIQIVKQEFHWKFCRSWSYLYFLNAYSFLLPQTMFIKIFQTGVDNKKKGT